MGTGGGGGGGGVEGGGGGGGERWVLVERDRWMVSIDSLYNLRSLLRERVIRYHQSVREREREEMLCPLTLSGPPLTVNVTVC